MNLCVQNIQLCQHAELTCRKSLHDSNLFNECCCDVVWGRIREGHQQVEDATPLLRPHVPEQVRRNEPPTRKLVFAVEALETAECERVQLFVQRSHLAPQLLDVRFEVDVVPVLASPALAFVRKPLKIRKKIKYMYVYE